MTRAVFSSLVLLQSCGPHKLVGCDPGRVLSSRVRSCFRFSSVRISLQQELNYTPPVGIEGQGQRGSGNPLRTENIYVTMPGAHDNSLLALFPPEISPYRVYCRFSKIPASQVGWSQEYGLVSLVSVSTFLYRRVIAGRTSAPEVYLVDSLGLTYYEMLHVSLLVFANTVRVW